MAKTNLDLSSNSGNADVKGAVWWECSECGDYAWLTPDESEPECSCSDDDTDSD